MDTSETVKWQGLFPSTSLLTLIKTDWSVVISSHSLHNQYHCGSTDKQPITVGYCVAGSPSHHRHLPPVKTKPHPPPQLLPTKKKTRCFACGKKTGLATTYQCRCGNSFCATHRYAEAHSCTYDYKSEGRKIIEQNNPVVAAPKLPKIWYLVHCQGWLYYFQRPNHLYITGICLMFLAKCAVSFSDKDLIFNPVLILFH